MNEPNVSPAETPPRFALVSKLTRVYARLGQIYFWIGTVLMLTQVVEPFYAPGKFVLSHWLLDWVLWFFFWPVMLIWYFGLFGYHQLPGR
jgi:hypothetical protein